VIPRHPSSAILPARNLKRDTPSDWSVMATDLEVARQFLDALAAAAKTGNRSVLYPFLASDVEWVTPKRDLGGIDEIRDHLTWLSPPETLDVDFEDQELTDVGDGRIVSNVRQVYRMKRTGDFAYVRERQIELTIHDGKIIRYEMRIVG
jgi:ketosteroid isomerase-like protein